MLKTPGLSFEFRQALELLDNALPIPSSNEHAFLGNIDQLLEQTKEVDESVSNSIEQFLKSCREIRRQQFSIKKENTDLDIKRTWLHLLVFGKDWVDILKEVTGFSLSKILTPCRIIKLSPHAKNEPYKVCVTLKNEFNISGEEFEQLFYPYLKKAFDIEINDYSVEDQLLKLEKSQSIEIDHEQSSKFINGILPKSIQYLAKWSGIEEISIGYPVSERTVPQVDDVISKIVIVPSCSHLSWKPDELSTIDSNLAWCSIWNAMDLPEQSPIHIVVSSNSEEFYPLIDKYLKKLKECYKYLSYKSNELFIALALRHITFTTTSLLRPGSKFNYLENIFNKTADDSGKQQNQLKINSDFVVNQNGLRLKLLERIGSMYFLKEVIDKLEEQGTQAVFVINEFLKGYNPKKYKEDKIKESFFLVKLMASEIEHESQPLDLIKVMFLFLEDALKMIIRNIGFIKIMLLTLEQIEVSQKTGWHWLYYKNSIDLKGIDKACQFLVRCALLENETSIRHEALAGVLYLVDPYDEIRDSEIETGFADDEYALAYTIYSLKQSKIEIPSKINNWVRDRLGKTDKSICKDSQKNIEQRLRYITDVLGKLSVF